MKLKKVTLSIFCAFAAVIAYFSVFGNVIRQNLYIPVTTATLKPYSIDGINMILRVVPHDAVHTDTDGMTYIWALSESDDIGEKYFYAEKIFADILAKDDIYTGIYGIQDGTVVIVTSDSKLGHGTRVKIKGDYYELTSGDNQDYNNESILNKNSGSSPYTAVEDDEFPADNFMKIITLALPAVHYDDPVDNTIKEAISKFTQETGIGVKVSAYSNAFDFNLKLLANETDFDVFVTENLDVFRTGAFYDLSDDKDINALYSNMYDGVRELFTMGGRLFGVPERIEYSLYRVISEEIAGLDISGGWTYDDIYGIALKLKNQNRYFSFTPKFGDMSYRPSFWSYAHAFSDTENKRFKDDGGALKTYIELQKKMYDNGMIYHGNIEFDTNTDVYFDTDSTLSNSTMNKDILYPVPKFTPEDRYPVKIYSYCINKFTKNTEEAKKLLLYLADEEILSASLQLPVYKSFYDRKDISGFTPEENSLFEKNKQLHESILKNSKKEDSNLDFIMYCIEQYILYDQEKQNLEETYNNIVKKGRLIFQE